MTEQNNLDNAAQPPKQSSIAKKIGLGAALVVLPVGALQVYNHLEAKADEQNGKLGKSFNYPDMAQLRQVDVSLIKYHEAGRIETNLQSPQAITLDPKGNLLVAAENIVRRLSPSGSIIADITVTGTPYCLAADEQGRTFVGFKDHVEIFSPDGKLAASWKPFSDRSYLTGLTVKGNDVWIADAGQRLILRCDESGKVLFTIGKPDPARDIAGLNIPSPHFDVAIASDGHVWTANTGRHRFEAYTPDGQLERYWGAAGSNIEEFFGCCNPTDFALLSDGSFITAEKGIARVKKYHPDGRFDCVIAPPTAFGDNQTGIDVTADTQGRVLVLERGTTAVRIFAPN